MPSESFQFFKKCKLSDDEKLVFEKIDYEIPYFSYKFHKNDKPLIIFSHGRSQDIGIVHERNKMLCEVSGCIVGVVNILDLVLHGKTYESTNHNIVTMHYLSVGVTMQRHF